MPTWSPWGSKMGRPTRRAAYTRPGLPDPVLAVLTAPSGELAVRALRHGRRAGAPPRALASLTERHATAAPAGFSVTTRSARSPFRLGGARRCPRPIPHDPPRKGAPRMAKHLDERARPSDGWRCPRGLAWGLGALRCWGLGVLTVAAVVRGRRDPMGQRSERGHPGHRPGAAAGPRAAVARTAARPSSRRSHEAQSTATRRPDLSRHAVRRVRRALPREVRSDAGLKPAVVLARKVADLSPATSTFTVAQSNILGSQHTPRRDGFAPGHLPRGDDGEPAGVARRRRRRHAGGAGRPAPVLQGRMAGYSFWPASALGHNGVRTPDLLARLDQFEMVTDGVGHLHLRQPAHPASLRPAPRPRHRARSSG